MLPSAGEPSEISVVRGDGQTGTVGQALDDSLVVLVSDPEDRPVEGVEVVFLPPAGAVLSPDDTVVTGANGQAAVHYTLATTAGDQMVQARAKPVVPTPSLTTVFHASALPEPAASLLLLGGNDQTGEISAALPESLAVRAVDRFGNGVRDVEVVWEATGGTVSPEAVLTAPDGRAAVERTLGNRPGPYSTTAAAASLEGSPVSFTATGITPPSPQLVLVTQPSSTASAGVPFDRQPVLQLQTAVGAPLRQADLAVTVQIASGSGSLGGTTTAASNADGVVAFTDLSVRGRPGERTLIFAASDFTSAISSDIDVGPGPPTAGRSSATVPNGVAGARTTVTLQLEDEFGTPVENAVGDIRIASTGANPDAAFEISDQGDGAYRASYTPSRVGTDLIDVQVARTALAGSPFASVVVAGASEPSTTTASVTKTGGFFNRVDITVTVRDAQGNQVGHGGDRVRIEVNGTTRAQPPADRGDGTYTDIFITLNPNPVIAITLNAVPIAGSPYRP